MLLYKRAMLLEKIWQFVNMILMVDELLILMVAYIGSALMSQHC